MFQAGLTGGLPAPPKKRFLIILLEIMQEKNEQYLTFRKRVENLQVKTGMSKGDAAKALGLSRTMLHYIFTGKFKITNKTKIRLSEAERKAGIKSESTATPIYIDKSWQPVRIYGLAQACSLANPPCDMAPEINEAELPTIPWPTKGKKIVGFKVEGDSMSPALVDGMIVVCDCGAEIVNGNIVVAKFDDVAVIKRYRRVGDTCLFTSDNSVRGKDYQVHCKKIDWMIKVIGFHGVVK